MCEADPAKMPSGRLEPSFTMSSAQPLPEESASTASTLDRAEGSVLPFPHPDRVYNVLGVGRQVETENLMVDEGLDLSTITCLNLRPKLHDLLLGEELIRRNREDGEALVVDKVVPETRVLAPRSRYLEKSF